MRRRFISRSSALGKLGVEHVPWSRFGNDLDDGVAAEPGQRFFQELDRPFEVERIQVAGDDVELALELRAERRPVSLEHEPDVVGFPRLGHLGIDGAGGAVPELAGSSVAIERAEDGLERAELAAPADHVVHPARSVVKEHAASSPSARSAGACPCGPGTCSRPAHRG